jgi:glutathione S-transferase
MDQPVLVGRSSSHFTRTARIFALELGVPHGFRPVLDMATLDLAAYGGNPALKIPVLLDDRGALFGTENICRELVRRSSVAASKVVMRGDVTERAVPLRGLPRVVSNAEELTLHVMSAEVSLIMAKASGDPHLVPAKVSRSIENSLSYLDDHVDAVLAALPDDRLTSFVEVTLFCLVTHLPFREVMDVARWTRLENFCRLFGERESARVTGYRFDAAQ